MVFYPHVTKSNVYVNQHSEVAQLVEQRTVNTGLIYAVCVENVYK